MITKAQEQFIFQMGIYTLLLAKLGEMIIYLCLQIMKLHGHILGEVRHDANNLSTFLSSA